MNNKIKNILQNVFMFDINTSKEIEIQDLINNFIKNDIKTNTDYKFFNINFYVKDTRKVHWKPKEHFTKIFNNEIENAKELYGLTRHEVLFLYSLSPYLLWEVNLLVDEKENPLNQVMLAKRLDLNIKTIQRYMKNLVEKKIIYEIHYGKEIYYLVNPFLMYCGKNINSILPALFINIGYKSNRINRKEKLVESL